MSIDFKQVVPGKIKFQNIPMDAIDKLQPSITNISDEINNLKADIDSLVNDIRTHDKDIKGLNKKSELLFNQITSTNKMVIAYVHEQLYNIEKLRLEEKRENLSHYIEEEILQAQLAYLISVPWYKKITKKQKSKIIEQMQVIQKEIRKNYYKEMMQIMGEIEGHTREKFFEKLKHITEEVKNERKESDV